MFKADRCFEVGQSYLAKSSWACDTDVIITVTKRTKRIIYFRWTSKRHGCDGVIHKARIKPRMKDLNGSGEMVEVGRTSSLCSGRYFCAWYDLISRMQEEEELVLSKKFLSYFKDKPVSREDLLARAAHSWAWCFAE